MNTFDFFLCQQGSSGHWIIGHFWKEKNLHNKNKYFEQYNYKKREKLKPACRAHTWIPFSLSLLPCPGSQDSEWPPFLPHWGAQGSSLTGQKGAEFSLRHWASPSLPHGRKHKQTATDMELLSCRALFCTQMCVWPEYPHSGSIVCFQREQNPLGIQIIDQKPFKNLSAVSRPRFQAWLGCIYNLSECSEVPLNLKSMPLLA